MIQPLDYFTSLVQTDASIPLFEAALVIGQDSTPGLDLSETQAELDRMAAQLRQRLPPDASNVQKLRMLNHYFYRELGFAANLNNFYDPDNSYLHRVLATRRGIPISLALIYMELAQHIGLAIKGISFPGHFLMKLSVPSGEIILDPTNGASLSHEMLEERLQPYLPSPGAELPLAPYLQAAPARAILTRMLHNLKVVFLQNHDWQRAIGVQQRLVILLPDNIIERRDRGLAYAHLECPQAALLDLEAYLQQHPYAPDAQELRTMLPALRDAGNRLN
jgi:regulator of sirC expression with transglutaminase-like and TPR domain